MVLNVILLIVGLVICFGGIYFKKLSAASLGFFWGVLVSAITIALIIISQEDFWELGSAFEDGGYIVIVLLIGFALAAACAAMDRLCAAINAFLSSFLILFLLIAALVHDLDAIAIIMIITVVLAGLLARLAYVYHNYAFMIVTAFSGAFLAVLSGMAIAEDEDISEFLMEIVYYDHTGALLLLFVITIALGAAGFFVQRNRLLQMQSGKNAVADLVKSVDLTQAKKTTGRAIEQAKNAGAEVGKALASAAAAVGARIKNVCETIKAEWRGRDLAEELKQDWLLFVPILVNTIVCNLIWMILRGNVNYIPAFYSVTNWLSYISAGMAAAVMVFFLLTKDLRMNLLYLIPWTVGFLIFNAPKYYESAGTLYPFFRTAILWTMLYLAAKAVKKDSVKPVLLSALYLVLELYLLDRIADKYYSYSFNPMQFVILVTMIAFLYWLLKNRDASVSHGKKKNLPAMLLGLAAIAVIGIVLISSKSTAPSQGEAEQYSDQTENQTDADHSQPDEGDAASTDAETGNAERQTELRPAAYFVGQPLSVLFEAFGEDYESYEYEGGIFLFYPEINVAFAFPWNDGIKEDTIVTTAVAGEGDYPLYAGINADMTYDEIKHCLEAEGTWISEPEGYQDEMNDQYVYSTYAQSIPGKINLNFRWMEEPFTAPVSEVIITKGA